MINEVIKKLVETNKNNSADVIVSYLEITS